MNLTWKHRGLFGNIVAFGSIYLNCPSIHVMVVSCLIFLLFASVIQLGAQVPPEPVLVEGRTMGTTYRVLYFDEPRRRNFQTKIDSLLTAINKAISTYDPESDISRFNKSHEGIRILQPHLYDILSKAADIHALSGGAFDPTVMPLVNAWGFGPGQSLTLSRKKVDSLKSVVGFQKVLFSRDNIRKTDPMTQLDMGGIGQGYGADQIFQMLRKQGVADMLVELGGEGIASGKNLQKDKAWTIGILDPNSTPERQHFRAYATLKDQAFTTSGNYFNYRIIGGRKYGHTIDPFSGYPVQHSLLSATVFAKDCTTADGWATAFMVMGFEKAKKTVSSLEGIDAIFMYSEESGEVCTYITPGIRQQVTLE